MSPAFGTIPASTATAEHDASERRAASRALLIQPILSAARFPDELALVRRHQAALKSNFATVLGYPLVVEAGFARLVKAPLSAHAPTRPARRPAGGAFTPRTYTYLALVCAGLLAPDTGEQVLLSTLVEQLRSDAAIAGITVDDTLTERRSLVAAIDLLISWGVLVETDGTVLAWGERHEEALLTVNRSLLPHLLARPLHTLTAPGQLWQEQPDIPAQPRRTLRRLLVDDPLVRREELTDAERDVLSRERTELTRMLAETFGLALEVRAEGALAYDPDDELTDVSFPGQGTVAQAALLLLDALADTLRPTAGTEAVVDGAAVPGVFAEWELVDVNLADLAEQHAAMWRADFGADPDRMRAEVVELLSAVGLVRVTDNGLVIHPSVARYRPQPQRAPARTRPRARIDDGTHPLEPDLYLLDVPTNADSE